MENEIEQELNQKLLQNDGISINDNKLGNELSQSNTLQIKPEQSPDTVPVTVTDGDGVVRDETVTADVAGGEDTVINSPPVTQSETETPKIEVDADVAKHDIKIEQGDEAGMNEQLVNGDGIVADKEEAVDANEEKTNVVGVKENDNDDEDEDDELMEKSSDTDEEDTSDDEEKLPVKTCGRRGRKRKRGRKSIQVTPGRGGKKIEEEEDVCFICFDGGDLVLCDKKDCPKAYHPSCIKRDEAFFQTKGKWNCGWHLCSICQKRAGFMCYTCTFSLCKTCLKTNVLYRVREQEKKGFCDTCMKTVMLIENSSQENQGDVDFDDKNSWEYFFKEYWTDVKEKLHFSLAELVEAKNARKGSEPADKQEPPAGNSDDGSESENPSEKLESQPRKTRNRKSKKQKAPDSDAIAYEGTSVPENTEWASKELLELVMHMGHDKSYQSQFDVQALLLEYIKTKKLRDTRRKSQIICDARLQRLFRKPRVGHFEMLKLLESHFLLKEDDSIQGSVVNTEASPVEDDESCVKDKKRKIRKKGDREPQSNREDYATIDIHNINIIYLKRKSVEDLLDDTETFHRKVVGTFVRIRISGANHKNDLYRLVQVTGTTKGEHYAAGKKMTDTMLEILNLDKKESISIDTISNQDFTEDECKRLRQSIKCGLINRPTVGNILDKAIELQPARVNDWLETEVVRLSHLRDRASDLGRKKELRECVEKLELLKKPEERARRLQDIPIIHDDPTMDPKYESEEDKNEDDKQQDMYKNSVDSRFSKRQDYPSKETRRDTGAGTSRSHGYNHEFSRNLSNNSLSNKVEDATSPRFKPHSEILSYVQQPSVLNKPSSTNETKYVSESVPKVDETEKMWNYKDPSGKIQGLFSMAQLRKWNNSKFFPVDLRIWRKSEKEEDGILLTHALEGRFITSLPSPTPKQSLGRPPVGPSSYHSGNEGLQSPTPSSSQVATSLVGGGSYDWSGGQSHNSQPSPSSNQWGSAQNIVQNPQPQPNLTWPTPGNETMNWDLQLTGNIKPLQAGFGSVSSQPAQVVTPSRGWVTGSGSPNIVGLAGHHPAEVSPVKNSIHGWGSPTENSDQGWDSQTENSNPGWSSSTARDRHQQYNISFSGEKSNRGRGSGFHENKRHWDKPRSFNNSGRPRDSNRFSDCSRGYN